MRPRGAAPAHILIAHESVLCVHTNPYFVMHHFWMRHPSATSACILIAHEPVLCVHTNPYFVMQRSWMRHPSAAPAHSAGVHVYSCMTSEKLIYMQEPLLHAAGMILFEDLLY